MFKIKSTLTVLCISLGLSACAFSLASIRPDAERGDPVAQFRMGRAYHLGRMAHQDQHMAAYWFEKAAAQSYAPGQTGLGYLYLYGLGKKQDFKKAKRLFELADAQDERWDANNLGEMYYRGIGVPKNKQVAKKYYQKSCDLELQDACDMLAKLQS